MNKNAERQPTPRSQILFINKCITAHNFTKEMYFFADLHSAISAEARSLGMELSYFDNNDSLRSFWREKRYRSYDGFIGIVPTRLRDEQYAWNAIERERPCVNCMMESLLPRGNFVGVDDDAAIRSLVQHLHDEGYRSMGFLCDGNVEAYALARARAFIKTLRSLGLAAAQPWISGYDVRRDIIMPPPTASSPRRAKNAPWTLYDVIASSDRPEAVVCCTDTVALDAYAFARSRGLRVPEDLAIVGINDHAPSFDARQNALKAGLTSARQQFSSIGREGVWLLHAIIRGVRPGYGQRVILAPTVILRASSLKRSVRRADAVAIENFKRETASYIDTHYAEASLSRSLARHFDIRHGYFLIKFKKMFAVNFARYVNEHRIRKALFYLTDASIPITDIAFTAGYHSYQNFTLAFKRSMHCSPSSYRDRHASIRRRDAR
ncbi:MAG: substrate-binding domain-containing protein [Spirochaetota bacterium]